MSTPDLVGGQKPTDSKKSHSLFRSVFPYDSLQDFEAEWHLGNYIIDRQTGKKSFEPMPLYVRLGMHLLYYGTPEATALHWKRTQDLLKAQSLKMGRQYDDPKSRDHIKPFIDSFELQESLKEMKEPDFTKYRTFNAFFGREIREDARPQASPQDPAVVTSPADCRLTAFPTVDLATKFWIKGTGFALPKLLASDTLAQKMDGGSLVIARLAPQDYHRWHAPVSGVVESITEVPGTYYTVNPQAITQEGTLDVFCENRRSVMVVRRSSTSSPVVIIAVGAMLVGSIKYNDGVKVGAEINRGQCLGAFYYGGSTVIVVYPKGEIKLDEDLVKNSMEQQCETYVKVGWRVGAGPMQ
ncbi:hypothetical protein LTR56_016851 [Elasticomyces elasticus]|nr:hypothetical protein LTR56_016851 [Elasticomyces elasticus]KAK4921644.1 hypothetical protein LTR49_010930 [Elasticomyces elasticus]KAK5758588.1 hypothetical protein LTS12_011287 [Elasticomyces elasticus]